MRMNGKIVLGVVCGFAFVQAICWGNDANEQLFVRRIAPLLFEKCSACHGSDEPNREGSLDLTTLESAQRGGDSETPMIVVGDPEKSPLYLAVLRSHENWSPMPPKEAERLTETQQRWVHDWILGGAAWPNPQRMQELKQQYGTKWSSEDGIMVKTSGGLSETWTERTYDPQSLWAYQPVNAPELSETGSAAIDKIIESRFPEGMSAAKLADARTLLRRATFDLTGLPPSLEEVTQFESEFSKDRDGAMKRLINRLLESPHYGERMAQHWLDVVRYADSSGFANDYERGNAWRYRDYVVRAFNQDKPYDEFIREQIAGDEIDASDPEKLIATGFLRMGPWELTGMEVAKIARQRFLDDVTNSVGETFLAHALQCARCHDHKFDPIPTRDYYSFQAVFGATQLAERPAPFLPHENTRGFEEAKYLERTRAEHQATLQRLDEKSLAAALEWYRDRGLDPKPWLDALEQASRGGPLKRRGLFGAARSILLKKGIAEDQFPPRMLGWTPEEIGLERIANKGLERLAWQFDRYEPYALAVYNGATPRVTSVNTPLRMPQAKVNKDELDVMCILSGGDPFSPADPVTPGVLSALTGFRQGEHQTPVQITDEIVGRRLELANWIADAKNPLTTRTIVNRIWLWHFGQPIAGNPNNFGSTGKRPTHPELLDWLAQRFVEDGWSFKKMHRTIMLSQAYQRASQLEDVSASHDRESMLNQYALFRPRRLTAEEIRDAALMATGELNTEMGGIPNRPEINLEAALQPRQVMGTFAAAWVPNAKPEQRHRRSLYALKLRGLTDPALEVFNLPAPDFSCERREVSTVTPQVFTLFNSKNSLQRALALADRAQRETQSGKGLSRNVICWL